MPLCCTIHMCCYTAAAYLADALERDRKGWQGYAQGLHGIVWG